MIAKIPKPGKSFGGCIQYNVLKKHATILYADGVRTGQVNHTIADFNVQRKMNPGLGQAVGHIALSWSPNDRHKLTDEKMVSIAQAYLQSMKIQDTQVLIVRHQDKQHPHLHIIYNRVNNDGKTIADNFQWQKSIRICKDLTLKHSLHIAQDKRHVNRQQLKGSDQQKYELHDAIRAVSQKVFSMSELKRELTKQGIGMQYKYKSGTLEIQGISFSKGQYKFKGSEIDRSLSYGKLSKQIKQQAKQKQIKAQEPSLADQLRAVINKGPANEQSHHQQILNPFGHFPTIAPEPDEPYRRKKKKGHDQNQNQGIGR
ncbi:MAG TPA: relaxase/mobilization nuclease domain-containing protein [Mucilaginibacter sp.]